MNPVYDPDPLSAPDHWRNESTPWPLYAVVRLDGPTALIASSLVDGAKAGEAGIGKGSGIGYFDFRNQFVQQKLQLEMISSNGKLATARVDGQLVMKRSFYPGRNDLQTIRASLIGFVTFEPQSRKLESAQLVTEKAYFGDKEFAAALRSVAPAEHSITLCLCCFWLKPTQARMPVRIAF